MFWTTVLVCTVLILLFRLLKPQHYWTNRNVKQVSSMPLLGDNVYTFFQMESFADQIRRLYNAYPTERYVGTYQMNSNILILRDLDLIKQIAVKDFDHFTDHRSFVPDNVDPLWAKNLFALKGDPWRDMRSTLSPAFTSSKMRAMFDLMEECAHQCTNYFLSKAQDDTPYELEMKDTFTRYANDVIATCAFGIKVDSLKEQDNEFYLMGKQATDFSGFWKNMKFLVYLMSPILTKVLNVRLFDANVSTFFRKIVKDTLTMREEQHIIRPDMINLLMEARKGRLRHEEESNEGGDAGFATVKESEIGKVEKHHNTEITDTDITAQALIFFFAGFDTVSTLMSFMAHVLAANPDIQERLREEIDETFVACKGKLSYDDLAKMKYMDMVISETLRMYPPVLALDRVCVKPYTIEPTDPSESPVKMPVNSTVWLPVMGIHYDPQYYPDPERFDPERFSEDNKHNINPATYIPFGVGPRNCIGSRFALMETKVVFFHLLSKFEIVVTKKSTVPIKMSKKQFSLTAEDGFWVGLKKRNID